MTTLLAGLEENSSSPANLSHCHPSSTCTLRCLIHMAPGCPETVGFNIVVLFIYCEVSVPVGLLTLACVGCIWRWLVTWKGWTMQPGWCPARVRAQPVSERTRKAPVLYTSYGNERSYLGVSVNLMRLHNHLYYYHKNMFFSQRARHIWAQTKKSTHSVVLITSSHTHVTLLPVQTFPTCCLFSRIYTVSSGISFPQGPIVLSQ